MGVYDDDKKGGIRGLLNRAENALDNRFSSRVDKKTGDLDDKKNPLTPQQIEDLEKAQESINDVSDKLGKGYTGNDEDEGKKKRRISPKTLKKLTALGIPVSIISALVGGFMTLGNFKLLHIMDNMEASTFARYQGVSVKGRTRQWTKAYMTARLLDIEASKNDSNYADNILFRADRNFTDDKGKGAMFRKWYDTVRGTNRTYNLEAKMFGEQGIKFGSVAYREGNQIKVRAVKITVKDTELDFDPFSGPDALDPDVLERALQGDFTALQDINRLTGKIDQFVEIKIFKNDVEANRAIKAAVNKAIDVRWFSVWNRYKRHTARGDIARFAGVRDWKFFAKTRQAFQAYEEKKISIRNKFLAAIIPEKVIGGDFLRCLFGISDCKVGRDDANPENSTLPPAGTEKQEDKKVDNDGDGTPERVGDGSGEANLRAGVGDGTGSFSHNLIKKLEASSNIASSLISALDSLSRFDGAIRQHKLSKIISHAKIVEAVTVYATMKVMADQPITGEITGEEFNMVMEDQFKNTTHTEAWDTIVENKQLQTVSAQSLTPANNKKQYCSPEFQAKLEDPKNREWAEEQYGYTCEELRPGGLSTAAKKENGWINGVGVLVHPIVVAYDNTIGPIKTILDTVNGLITEAVYGPILRIIDGIKETVTKAITGAIGVDKLIDEFIAWASEKALAYGGGGPSITDNSPTTKIGTVGLLGGASTAEATSRLNGAALTTDQSKQDTLERYAINKKQELEHQTIAYRYLSLDNPQSVASNALFALIDRAPSKLGTNLLGSLGSIFTSPLTLLSSTTHAATNFEPYRGCEAAGIDCYDMPKECLDADPTSMTPTSATNADEEGLLTPAELNWEVLQDKDAWYKAIYEKAGDSPEGEERAMKIWNCVLLDDGISGALGAPFGYKSKNLYPGGN